MHYCYKLIGKLAVPASFEDIEDAFRSERHVASTQVGCLLVSTVFLVLNHAFDDGPPKLFETMIFDDGEDQYQTRCSTWDEAESMHATAVGIAKDRVLAADLSTAFVRSEPGSGT